METLNYLARCVLTLWRLCGTILRLWTCLLKESNVRSLSYVLAFLFTTAAFATPIVETFPICTAPGNQSVPAISGNIVVWQDNRAVNPGIYGYNLETKTEFPISTERGDVSWLPPDIDGNIVVWCVGGYIRVYNLVTQAVFDVCSSGQATWPKVNGNLIVWMDGRKNTIMTSDWDIYGYDIQTGQEFPIVTEPGNQMNPSVYGNQVLFDQRVDNGYNQVFSFTPSDVTSAPGILAGTLHNQSNYFRDGDWLVWIDDRNGSSILGTGAGNTDIYGYNFATGQETAICTARYEQWHPVISDPIIAWQDFRNGQWDIYGYSLVSVSTPEFLICNNIGAQGVPDIDGKYFVWTDYRTGEGDIWGASIVHMPEPETIVLLVMAATGITVMFRRRRDGE